MRQKKTRAHSFTLVLCGFRELSRSVEDALFEAGCDDGLLGVRCGVPFLDFDREAGSFPEAVFSALEDVASAGAGVQVVRVEPDDLVNASEIARRVGRSRESVRLLANGTRGPGEFPAPVANLRGSSPIWSWVEVCGWFLRNGVGRGITESIYRNACLVVRVNEGLSRGFAGPWELPALTGGLELPQG